MDTNGGAMNDYVCRRWPSRRWSSNLPKKRVWTNKHKDAWTSSWPRIRQGSTEDKREKTKLLLLMGLQKIVSHASGSAENWGQELCKSFVFSVKAHICYLYFRNAHHMNFSLRNQMGMLIFKYSQVWNASLAINYLVTVILLHRNDETMRWYCHQISHVNIDHDVL